RSSRVLAALALAAGLGWAAVLPPAGAQQPTTPPGFTNAIVVRDSDRVLATVRALAESEAWKRAIRDPAGSTRAGGLQALADGTDQRNALRLLSLAAALDGKDQAAWLGMARAALAITPDGYHASERYELPATASGAAWQSYQLASAPSAKADSLAVL